MTLQMPVWLQKGNYTGQNDRWLADTLLEVGVLDAQTRPAVDPAATGSGSLKATANATTLSVDIAAGTCVVAGSDQTFQGKYVCISDATANVTLAARPAAGQNRIDVVHARVVDTAAGVSGTDGWVLDKVTGTPTTGTPAVPALPTSALALANVTVGGGTGATVGANAADLIVDVRRRMRLRGPVQGWPPATLSWPASAGGNIVGFTGLTAFTIGPYPCGWTAAIDVVQAVQWTSTGVLTAFSLQVAHYEGGTWVVYDQDDQTRSSDGYNGLHNRLLWAQADGTAQQFRVQIDRLSGAGTGILQTAAQVCRIDALVAFQP
jgi:hypothetical protein